MKRNREEGGYGVYLSAEKIKDCREGYKEGICLVSAANSCLNLVHKFTGLRTTSASYNAELKVVNGRAYLRSIKTIRPNEEILYKYSSSYGAFL
jgi:hypothetical protein